MSQIENIKVQVFYDINCLDLLSPRIRDFSAFSHKFQVRFRSIMLTFQIKFWYFLGMRHLNDEVKALLALKWTNHLQKP